ncbi:biotin--[acetyl-CoA-carboxylase] ligase [Rhodococcus aerolatus]
MTHPDRAAPDEAALRGALCPPAGGWAAVDVVATTGSTNADLAVAAERGAADRTVLLAHAQDAGRGRRERSWSSPPGAGLACSVLLRPAGVPAPGLGWLPLLTGLAVAEALAGDTGLDVGLKWPNDVLVGDRKLAGVLAELVPGPAVVVGLGLNVSLVDDELPVPWATSLALLGVRRSVAEVAVAVLGRLDTLERRWRGAGGDVVGTGLAQAYRGRCTTLGREVRVELAAGELVGRAEDVDADGRLLVRTGAGVLTPVLAGDVTHLRPA